MHINWNGVNPKEIKYEKIQMKKTVFYSDLIGKPNVEIKVITVSMWQWHDFETILTSNDVTNIQNSIGQVFASQERAYSMWLNSYFGPIRKNIPHATPNY